MIPETENASSWPPVVAVAVAAVALGGVWYLDPPLESQRPSNPSTGLEASQHPRFPLARLWQDPLHVVYEHWKTVDEPKKSIPFVTQAFVGVPGSNQEADDNRHVLRLLVMLPGTPYSDDREQRRRQRHAIVSALTSKEFVPSDGAHLRYFHAPPFRNDSDVADAASVGSSSNDTTLVGYERYEPNVESVRSRWASVEVFWLNTEDFHQHPLHKVSALVAALESGRPSGNATTVMLGPPSSDVLREMFEEDKKMPQAVLDFLEKVELTESSARKARAALRFLSHRATIPVKRLACRPDDANCPKDFSQELGVESFHSSIADDGQVLEAVLKELEKRGACAREQPTVVIVSEQDTVYGRLLGDLAEHAAKQVGKGKECEIQIAQYGYLRGVDGEMPPPDEVRTRRDELAQEEVDAERGERGVPSLPGGGFEQPFGASQLDYVRRLSERLLKDGPNARPVAIGLLGNDLYDKLLILQALRESHPGAVFFTTDMDARLLDPAVNRWTRNLIVGSAYGLSPLESASDPRDLHHGAGDRDCRPQATPESASDTYRVADSFRDSYQVAMFVTVQQAVDGQWNRCAPEPQLFEISRTHFFQLGSQASDRDEKQVTDLQTLRAAIEETLLTPLAVLLTPLAALVVFALVMCRRQREEAAGVHRWLYGFVAVLASAAAVWLYMFAQGLLEKEPGPLFDGVSTVPLIVLQITTIVFAVAIVCFANGRMRQTLSHVSGHLGGTESEPKRGMGALRAAGQEWQSEGIAVLVSAWKHDIANGEKGSQRDAAKLWSDVLRYHEWWPRFARIGVGLLVGMALRQVYFKNARIDQPLLGQALTTPGWMTDVLPVAIFWAISYCRDTIVSWRKFVWALGHFDITGGRIGDMQSKAAVRARRSMDLLVYCTDVIGPVVVMPLILMVLLMLGRSTLFDGWNWAMPLIVFHVGLSIYVLSIAIGFQREASQARAKVLVRLRDARLNAKNADSSTEIGHVMEYIKTRRDGAFVSWAQHPILQTLALPLGSFTLITLLEMWVGRVRP